MSECDRCKGKGWLLIFNMNLSLWAFERCDLCKIFQNDEAAGDQARKEVSND